MISCKFCGNENMDNAQQCYICGKSLASAQINSLVNVNGDQQQQSQYHGVNDNLPYGSNVQVATRFQSDTGGGAHSGPTQQSFGAQMMAGKEEKKGSAKTVIAVILMLAAIAALVWYLCFSDYAIIHF